MLGHKTAIQIAAAAAFVAVASLQPAQAQETIKITSISGYPPPATWVGAFINAYVPAVDAALAKTGKYKIDWNLAHSGQIAKPRGEFEAIESGLGEIGLIPGAFHADKIPLYNIPYVTPFTNDGDPAAVTAAYEMLQAKFPAFAKNMAEFNQVQIGVTDNVDNYILLSTTPLKTLSDLKGKKVGAAGPNLPWVVPTGAAGVSTNLGGAYNSLTTGIYDAMIVWRQAMGAFKLCEPAPHMLDAGLGAASIIPLTVNSDFWGGLPGEVKTALSGAAKTWSDAQIKLLLEGAGAGLTKCETEYNTVASKMAPAERAKWASGMAPLALDWAKQTDAKGFPATEILTAYMDFMRANGQPVTRNWDKE
jgi:TRAP-type C4-dicarboxylate transport system substrate-binding protein